MIHPSASAKAMLVATLAAIPFVLSGCTEMPAHDTNRPILELNTDRPGSDISTIPLDEAKPVLCSDACRSDEKCVAWTYVKPGRIDAHAHCRLKSDISDPVRDSCCISGIK